MKKINIDQPEADHPTVEKSYNSDQINACIEFLGYSVKHGGLDDAYAQELIDLEAWGEVFELMDKADAHAEM